MYFYFFIILHHYQSTSEQGGPQAPRPHWCGCSRGQAKLFAFVAASLVKLLGGAAQAENTVHAVIVYSFLLNFHCSVLDKHNVANKKHKQIEKLNKKQIFRSLCQIILLTVKFSILRYYQAPFGLIKSQMDSLDFFRYMHKKKECTPLILTAVRSPSSLWELLEFSFLGFQAISRSIFSL